MKMEFCIWIHLEFGQYLRNVVIRPNSVILFRKKRSLNRFVQMHVSITVNSDSGLRNHCWKVGIKPTGNGLIYPIHCRRLSGGGSLFILINIGLSKVGSNHAETGTGKPLAGGPWLSLRRVLGRWRRPAASLMIFATLFRLQLSCLIFDRWLMVCSDLPGTCMAAA